MAFSNVQIHTYPPLNTRFIWLCSAEDFDKCSEYLSDRTCVSTNAWERFQDENLCLKWIKQESSRKLILISSGRFLQKIINDIHSLSQLHAIYIYCQKPDNYMALKNNYAKVRGVYVDPVHLLDQMCENFDAEARQMQEKDSYIRLGLLVPRNSEMSLPCLFRNEIRSYSLPNTSWSPWETNNCSVSLSSHGQGTIEIWLNEPCSFELSLSNNSHTDRYALVLKGDTRQVQLSIQDGNILHVKDSTDEYHHVIQTNKGFWYCYWLTFYGKNGLVQYGIGEIRPKFKILEAQLSDRDKSLIETISYLHIKINSDNTTDPNTIKDKIKIFIGKEPIIFDPPLLIISPDDFSATDPANNIGILASTLKSPLKDLYEQVIHFTLEDQQFPHLLDAIERSIQNPKGWCYNKLSQKANLFGRPKKEATYLSLLIYECKSQCSLVMKIWPPGHYTPIHNHGDVYSVIRVLHGKLLIKYFPILSIHHTQNDILEQIFEKNSITWMIPKLNQIQQMKNPDMYGSCCIAIQCFYHTNEKQTSSERFAFVLNDGSDIKYNDCEPDDDLSNFKRNMQIEWDSASSM